MNAFSYSSNYTFNSVPLRILFELYLVAKTYKEKYSFAAGMDRDQTLEAHHADLNDRLEDHNKVIYNQNCGSGWVFSRIRLEENLSSVSEIFTYTDGSDPYTSFLGVIWIKT